MALRDVLLLTSESATINAVSAALSTNGQLSKNNVYGSLAEVISRLERGGVPAVLIDIDDQPKNLLPSVEPLARKYGDTKFIALSAEMRQELLFDAMAVGVRHVLLKASVPADLSNVLHRLCPPTGSGQGKVVSILSAGGGCGATTLAVNLTAELPMAAAAPNLVMDLDHTYGAVGTYLGLDGEYGAFDLLRRSDHLDGQLVQSTALASGNAIHALLSMARRRLGEVATLEPQRTGELVDACKGAYHWSVIDAPRVPLDVAAEIAQRSHITLLLMQLTIKDIHVARHMLAGLSLRGLNPSRVMVFVTRYRKRGQAFTLDEARKALGLTESQPLGTLSNDFAGVTEAANLGKPLSAVAPRSDYRRDVQKLATTIVGLQASSVARTVPAVSAV